MSDQPPQKSEQKQQIPSDSDPLDNEGLGRLAGLIADSDGDDRLSDIKDALVAAGREAVRMAKEITAAPPPSAQEGGVPPVLGDPRASARPTALGSKKPRHRANPHADGEEDDTVATKKQKRFADSDRYACSICRDTARNAMTCENGCVYCRACLMKATKFVQPATGGELRGQCQVCRVESAFATCPFINREVRDAPAECSNGCGAKGLTVSTVEAHEAACGYRYAACRNAKYGCAWVGKAHEETTVHNPTCGFKVHAEFAEGAARMEKRWGGRFAELSERVRVLLGALSGVICPATAEKPSVWFHMDAITDRRSFDVAGRSFSFRAEPLARDPDIPELKQAYGCCVVRKPPPPAVQEASAAAASVLWVRMQVILAVGETAVGVGTVIGTFSEAVPSALRVEFMVPVTQPPPWTVLFTAINMKPVDSSLSQLS
jgi:hypothetical protein